MTPSTLALPLAGARIETWVWLWTIAGPGAKTGTEARAVIPHWVATEGRQKTITV